MKKLFYLYPKERRGSIGLVISLLLGVGFYTYTISIPAQKSKAISHDQMEMILSSIDQLEQKGKKEKQTENSLFAFDPNTASKEELLALGLKSYVADNLINYRSKGGRIKTPADISKIYGISDYQIKRLTPYIQIAPALKKTTNTNEKHRNWEKEERVIQETQHESKPIEYAMVPFDPNTVSEEELIQMGWQDYPIKSLLNYRKKGGQIRKTEDLQKLYGVDSSLYAAAAPYIQIAAAEEPSPASDVISEVVEFALISLNSANEEELKNIKGIGAARAKAITEYREKLGGYLSTDQLREISILDDASIAALDTSVFIVNTVKMIDVKSVDFKELMAHPYVDYKLAKILKNYFKERHQSKQEVETFIAKTPMYAKQLKKLKPYLINLSETQYHVSDQ